MYYLGEKIMWPIEASDIQRLQIEVGNYCNLACPGCARDVRKARGITLDNKWVDLDFFHEHINTEFLPKISQITLCGNVEEPTINPQIEQIVDYLINQYPAATINISTNGSTRNAAFWERMGLLSKKSGGNFFISFAIDGLEDTNHIYRVGSSWKKIMENVKAFIAAGGKAIWQFVVFEHTKDQVEQAKQLSDELGFYKIRFRYSGRLPQDKEKLPERFQKTEQKVVCQALSTNKHPTPSIFINHNGDVTPCCWQDLNNGRAYKELKKITVPNSGNDLKNKFAYNLFYSTIDEIISGPLFSTFYNNFNRNAICLEKCKKNLRDYIDDE